MTFICENQKFFFMYVLTTEEGCLVSLPIACDKKQLEIHSKIKVPLYRKQFCGGHFNGKRSINRLY